jgi:hypothetical protein
MDVIIGKIVEELLPTLAGIVPPVSGASLLI